MSVIPVLSLAAGSDGRSGLSGLAQPDTWHSLDQNLSVEVRSLTTHSSQGPGTAWHWKHQEGEFVTERDGPSFSPTSGSWLSCDLDASGLPSVKWEVGGIIATQQGH